MISSKKCWIDGKALAQLHKAATLPGMFLAVGLPDLHAGQGRPVGSVFAATGLFYPDLIGTDIGCGVALWRTDLSGKKTSKIPKWARKLDDLDQPWDGDAQAWLAAYGVESDGEERALGTIGAGNHFADRRREKGRHDRAPTGDNRATRRPGHAFDLSWFDGSHRWLPSRAKGRSP